MKGTGIVRRIDEFGRVVIPKEIRRGLGWKEGTPLELFMDDGGEGVVLRTYDPIYVRTLENIKEAMLDSLSDQSGIGDKIEEHFNAIIGYWNASKPE